MEQYNSGLYEDLGSSLMFVIAIIILVVILVNMFMSFKSERDYIKMEIERSTKKEELLYWKEELRRFYIRKIPIIGDLLLNDDEYDDYDE